jgi:hypothetical protein
MIRRTVQQKADQLITDVVEVRRAILDAAQALPPLAQSQVFLGVWDIQDLLAHLTGWDYANIQAAHEIQAGQVPEFYSHYDPDWRTYNAALVACYRQADFLTQLDCVRESHQALLGMVRALPPAELFLDRGLRVRGYKVIIARLLEADLKDVRVHLAQIQEFHTRLDA